MLGIFIILFEILMVVLFGIFIRIDNTHTASMMSSLDLGLFFIAAYAFVNVRYRNLDWTALTNYLFIAMISLQINTLYYCFWVQVFNKKFTATAFLSSQALISSLQSTLTVTITASLFMSKLSQSTLFILIMFETFFFALNWAICSLAIHSITAGGASTIWLFGLVFGSCIKKLGFTQTKPIAPSKYFTKTLQAISLIILIILWPTFNQITTSLDKNLDYLLITALLPQNSYIQTWLCLFSSVVTSLGLQAISEKMNLDKIISTIVNTGILISSCSCVIIDPYASILIGVIGPILGYLYDRFGQYMGKFGYPIDGICMAFLGSIFSCIFCGARNNRIPALSTHPLRQGGLQCAALVVSLLFAVISGLITGFIFRFTGSQIPQLTDMGIWHIEPEMMPFYPDDPKYEKYSKQTERTNAKIDNQGTALNQRFMTEKQKQILMMNSIKYPRKRVIKEEISKQSHPNQEEL